MPSPADHPCATSGPLWRLNLHRAGTYRVELEYAMPPHPQGTLARVLLGEQSLPFVSGGTGGWGEYVRAEVGVLNLHPHDELSIRVQPEAMPVGAVRNLRAVHLTPCAEP